ncbi:MAG: DNA-3-methyladenine glycosylase 2 family protein [Chloroflexi bacterium]|nr:DNA-3-methyladenine glycosylase 2 family protein [Chloroflexota bacterium]
MLTPAPIATLSPRPPFDFGLVRGYLGRSPLEPLDVVADGRYRRAVRLNGSPALLEVRSVGTVDAPALELRVLDPGADRGLLPLAERLLARCLRLDENPAGLDPIAAADPVFGALLARLRGVRQILMPSPFETLIWAILGQQINVAFAYKLKRTLVQRYGDAVDHEGRAYYFFPEPARLAAASPTELRTLQLSRQKAEYIIALSELEAADAIDWESLRAAPTPEAVASLATLRGVGRWTAEYVCMRGLGHRDVIPAADLGLRAAIGRAYGLDRTASEVEVRAIAEPWAGWRSHAAFCWWYSLAPGLTT